MVDGEAGHHGLLVIGTLDGNSEGGIATIRLLKMEETNALALGQKEDNVQVFSDLKTMLRKQLMVNTSS